eukprot:957359_1
MPVPEPALGEAMVTFKDRLLYVGRFNFTFEDDNVQFWVYHPGMAAWSRLNVTGIRIWTNYAVHLLPYEDTVFMYFESKDDQNSSKLMYKVEISDFNATTAKQAVPVDLPDIPIPASIIKDASITSLGDGKFMFFGFSRHIPRSGQADTLTNETWIFDATIERFGRINLEVSERVQANSLFYTETAFHRAVWSIGGACCNNQRASNVVLVHILGTTRWIRTTQWDQYIPTLDAPAVLRLNNYSLVLMGGALARDKIPRLDLTDALCIPDIETDNCTGEIRGNVFNDLNGDLTLKDRDAGLGNFSIELFVDRNEDGRLGEDELRRPPVSKTTDSLGHFVFSGLHAGAYIATVANPNALLFKQLSASETSIEVDQDQTRVLQPFVFRGLRCTTNELLCPKVFGYVFLDKDENGRKSQRESGIAKIRVELQILNPGAETEFRNGTTDFGGYFSFDDLPIGKAFRVSVLDIPSGYIMTSGKGIRRG